jgi:hypothetical protein
MSERFTGGAATHGIGKPAGAIRVGPFVRARHQVRGAASLQVGPDPERVAPGFGDAGVAQRARAGVQHVADGL